MSTNSVATLPVVGLYDQRINAQASQNQVYVAHKGASLVTKKVFTTTSFSDSSFQFSTPPPNNKIFVDRLVWLRVPGIQFTFDVDVRPGLGSTCGLRQWPLGGICQTTTCNLNNNQTSVVTSDVIHALTRYSTNHWRQDRVNSLSASMADQYQDYVAWHSASLGGSARNPLGAYGEQYYQNRGAIQPDSVSLDGKTLTYSLMEPIWLLSPFLQEEEEYLGLINVSTMDWNFNLVSNLGPRMWCSDNTGPAITSVSVHFSQSPELHFNYLTPPELMYIPDNISYPFYNVIRYANPPTSLVAGGSITTSPTNNIQLTEIPKRIYIYVQRNNSEKLANNGFLFSDTFASISNVTVTFNNLSSMFANYQQSDLYDLSRKNGLEMSWMQFSNFCGSVIAFDPSYDFGLPSILSAGSLGQFNLQVTLTYTNTGLTTVNYVPYIVIVNEGIMNIGNNGTIIQTGVLSRAAVLNSNNLPQIDYEQVMHRGGSIFGRLKSFLQRAKPFINKLARVGQVVGTIGSKVGLPYAQQIQQGSTLVRQLTGGRKRMYKRRGRGLYGAGVETMPQDNLEV